VTVDQARLGIAGAGIFSNAPAAWQMRKVEADYQRRPAGSCCTALNVLLGAIAPHNHRGRDPGVWAHDGAILHMSDCRQCCVGAPYRMSILAALP
jgi:hypothetical protein